jgi:lysophospholipase L1-like esterase
MKQFSTDGELEPKVISYRTNPGTHSLKLLTMQNRPVRLLGWSNDNDQGITYESLGINGAEASIFFRWKRKMMTTYLRQRDPALLVLAYGSNESSDETWTSESYHAMFSALLARLREDCPGASILVLGPTDRMTLRRGEPVEVQGVDRIIAAQRQACRDNGCAYWSAKMRMGGSGSMRNWTRSGLGQNDYVHFTPSGYSKLADILYGDIMGLYDSYLKVPVPHPQPKSSN